MGERSRRWMISSAPNSGRAAEREPDTSSETVRIDDVASLFADQEDTRPSTKSPIPPNSRAVSSPHRPSVTIVAPVPPASRSDNTGSLPALELDEDSEVALYATASVMGESIEGATIEVSPTRRRTWWWVSVLSAAMGMAIGAFSLLIVLFALLARR